MKKLMISWLRDLRGATAVEYGLIVATIALVIIGAIFAFGADLNALFLSLMGWFSA